MGAVGEGKSVAPAKKPVREGRRKAGRRVLRGALA